LRFGSIIDPTHEEQCKVLLEFKDVNGSPVYTNPQWVIAVREEKHFGRPGVGTSNEYRDTLVLTTKVPLASIFHECSLVRP
jgi:hypothetical protein